MTLQVITEMHIKTKITTKDKNKANIKLAKQCYQIRANFKISNWKELHEHVHQVLLYANLLYKLAVG
jgi:hypothetical protein